MKKSNLSAVVLLVVFTFCIALVPITFGQVETVKVLDYSYYIDFLGNLVLVGEVQNIGTTVLKNVDRGQLIQLVNIGLMENSKIQALKPQAT